MRLRRGVIFTVGWATYASTYMLRKPFGIVKGDVEIQFDLSKLQLGWLDIATVLPYAIGQIYFSSFCDKWSPPRLLFCTLMASASSCSLIGWCDNYSILFLLLSVSSAAQSLCWPCVSKVVGSWYPHSSRNVAFGMLGVSASVGSIIGTVLAAFLQDKYDWKNVYPFPSAVVILMAFICLVYFDFPELIKSDGEKGISAELEIASHSRSQVLPIIKNAQAPRIPGLRNVWNLRFVPSFCFALFCVKMVRYIMHLWLNMYFVRQANSSNLNAGLLSSAFDLGGMVGGLSIGWMMNRYFPGKTYLGIASILALETVSLLTFAASQNAAASASLLFIIGACNLGPDSLLGGSLPYEVGEKDGQNAGATVSGFVNGFGTLGGVVEGPLVGLLVTSYGWSSLSILTVLLSSAACVVLGYASMDIQSQDK